MPPPGLLSRLKSSWCSSVGGGSISPRADGKKVAPESTGPNSAENKTPANNNKKSAGNLKSLDEEEEEGGDGGGRLGNGGILGDLVRNPRLFVTECMNSSLAVDTSKPSHYRVRS